MRVYYVWPILCAFALKKQYWHAQIPLSQDLCPNVIAIKER